MSTATLYQATRQTNLEDAGCGESSGAGHEPISVVNAVDGCVHIYVHLTTARVYYVGATLFLYSMYADFIQSCNDNNLNWSMT